MQIKNTRTAAAFPSLEFWSAPFTHPGHSQHSHDSLLPPAQRERPPPARSLLCDQPAGLFPPVLQGRLSHARFPKTKQAELLTVWAVTRLVRLALPGPQGCVYGAHTCPGSIQLQPSLFFLSVPFNPFPSSVDMTGRA